MSLIDKRGLVGIFANNIVFATNLTMCFVKRFDLCLLFAVLFSKLMCIAMRRCSSCVVLVSLSLVFYSQKCFTTEYFFVEATLSQRQSQDTANVVIAYASALFLASSFWDDPNNTNKYECMAHWIVLRRKAAIWFSLLAHFKLCVP